MTPFTSMEGIYQIKWPWDWQAARRRDKTQKPAGCCLRGTAVPAVWHTPRPRPFFPWLSFGLWAGRTEDPGRRPDPLRRNVRMHGGSCWLSVSFFFFFWPTRLLAVGDDGWTFFCWSRDETGIIRAAGLSVISRLPPLRPVSV